MIPPPGLDLLTGLVDCLDSSLTDVGAGPVCWCGLFPGGVPTWDYCGECDGGKCGIGWVTVTAITPYTSFGVPAASGTCAYGLQAVVLVGAARCVPMEVEGLPEPDELAVSAVALHADAYAIRHAVSCCLPADTILQGWAALPAQGGCAGGQWSVILDLEP